MKKPPEGGWLVDNGRMEITDYMWIKLIVLGVAAFVYEFWRAFTGR